MFTATFKIASAAPLVASELVTEIQPADDARQLSRRISNRPEEHFGQLPACPEQRPAGPGRRRRGRRLRQLPRHPQPESGGRRHRRLLLWWQH